MKASLYETDTSEGLLLMLAHSLVVWLYNDSKQGWIKKILLLNILIKSPFPFVPALAHPLKKKVGEINQGAAATALSADISHLLIKLQPD